MNMFVMRLSARFNKMHERYKKQQVEMSRVMRQTEKRCKLEPGEGTYFGERWSQLCRVSLLAEEVTALRATRLQRLAGMASPTNLVAEEQVHCSICLDLFTNPVSIPCGHNFCMTCILGYWKTGTLFQCPMCKKTFFKQPDVSINTVLREISEQFKELRASSLLQQQKQDLQPPLKDILAEIPELIPPTWTDEVSCDVCTGFRLRAVKSCLVCLTSYCEEHIKSHSARFTKHKLVEPVPNLEDRMCKRHERLLELFCKKDQTIVCVLCTERDHRAHYTIPVEREWAEKKTQLRKTEGEVQQMIQDRLKKVEEIKHSVELNKNSALREVEDSMQVFSELVRAVQKAQAELVLAIEEKQREMERWAQALITELEQEIMELKKRSSDLERLSGTEDHIHFLQNFPALSTHPQLKDWFETSVPTEQCVGTIRRAVANLEDTLAEEVEKLAETELRKIQKYSVDVTLDPDTANPWLQLSEDCHQLRHLGAWQDLPDNPGRFDTVVIALGREGFTSGRHYWEVQVGEKDDWYLGVARTSVNRKGRISVSTAHGYWALAMKKGQEYRASSSPPLLLTLGSKLKRVGVYLDYDEGQVSFYDVQAKSHIYTFTDTFREKLYPFFYLYCCDKASDTIATCPANEKVRTKQCLQ
ncbi:E3 ubiquitin-protein ligase TRIM39 [Denticeps clupeoides]|uniref:E3 ubiquitin-protein ligase TRIM39 n=1 Tax=Denticeps clupeoides TaxID=299321 RepID=UPI0010A5718B|nr:E3 ubiquitin-protein ligase TRIM39-like [Denticeps clupeoides]